MRISQDYRASRHGNYGGSRIPGWVRWCGAIAAILLLSAAITAILEGGAKEKAQNAEQTSSGIASEILAPLPMQTGSESATAVQTQYGPTQQSEGAYELVSYDSAVIRQPACGEVDLSYFSDAAFLGDSLTEGFTEYSINLGGALICGYKGAGPDTVVNCTKVTHQERGEEIILDTLAAAQPKKLYILLGTNTLTTAGSEERFLTYYSAMLDTLRTQLGDDCVIYVQSIPPVRPAVQEERSGLASDNLRAVNESLAQMAAEKGCVYLDLWEALADGDGNLSDLYDAPDGIHLSAGDGYSAWVSYLRTHAVYAEDNEWTPGSVYAQE
jgi:lysophospholipase L1-like esterase